jgi:hypothetical protein
MQPAAMLRMQRSNDMAGWITESCAPVDGRTGTAPERLATSRRKIDVSQPLVNGMRQDKSRRAVRRGVKRAVMAPTPTG